MQADDYSNPEMVLRFSLKAFSENSYALLSLDSIKSNIYSKISKIGMSGRFCAVVYSPILVRVLAVKVVRIGAVDGHILRVRHAGRGLQMPNVVSRSSTR